MGEFSHNHDLWGMILWGMSVRWLSFFLEKPDRSVCCLLTKSQRTWGLLGAAHLWYYQKTEDCAHYVSKLRFNTRGFWEKLILGTWELQKLWLVGTTIRKNLPKRAVEQFVCFFFAFEDQLWSGVEGCDKVCYSFEQHTTFSIVSI